MTTPAQDHGWYRIVAFGGAYHGPHGPWRSVEAASAALDRYAQRIGECRYTVEVNDAQVRILGPYRSRRAARAGSIADDHVPAVVLS